MHIRLYIYIKINITICTMRTSFSLPLHVFFFLFLFSPLLPSLIFFFLFQSMNNSHKANVVRLFTCIFLNYAYTGMVFFIPIPPFSTLVSKNSVLEEDRHNRWQRSAFGNSMRACLARCFDQRATVIVVVHLFMEKRKKKRNIL